MGPDSVWTSPDGREWTLTSATGLPQRAGDRVAVLMRTAGGFIAAGANAPGGARATPVIFLSADGRKWERSGTGRLNLAAGTGRALDIRLAAAGGGFTATGTFGATPGDRDVVVWTSKDGTTWQAATPTGPGLAAPGIQAITGLTVSGRTLTGVGFTATPAGEQPTLWQPPIW